MAIQIPSVRKLNWNDDNITPLQKIKDFIFIAKHDIKFLKEAIETKKISKYFHDAVERRVARLIRDCNGALGAGGSFKKGCLYLQSGLKEDGNVVLDHAIPIKEIVNRYMNGRSDKKPPLELLIFYPVVKISREFDHALYKAKVGDAGYKAPLIFSRYQIADEHIEIFSHNSKRLETEKFTEACHWKHLQETANSNNDLKNIIDGLGICLDKIIDDCKNNTYVSQ